MAFINVNVIGDTIKRVLSDRLG